MSDVHRILRDARWPEAFFAVIALYLALGVPIPPPDGQAMYSLVHWYGMVGLAVGLVFALRRPSRVTWAVAVGLSAYFLFNVLWGLSAWRAITESPAAQYSGPAIVLSYMIAGSAALAQLVVALLCWRARSIWMAQTPSAVPPLYK